MPQKIYLIRHGETDYNRERRMQGWLDIPLNASGRAQAEKTAHSLMTHKIHHIYSSDLLRAHQTAIPLALHHKLTINLTPKLRERDMGVFSGWAWETERNTKKDKLWADFNLARDTEDLEWHAHGGESLRQMTARIVDFFDQLHLTHPGQVVAVVTHGGTINRIFEHYNIKKSIEGYRIVGNGAVYVLHRQHNGTYELES